MNFTTRHDKEKPDGWIFNLFGKSSYFIKNDHMLIVELLLVVDSFTRIDFKDVRLLTSRVSKSPVRFILHSISLVLQISFFLIILLYLFSLHTNHLNTFAVCSLSALGLPILYTLFCLVLSLNSYKSTITITTFGGTEHKIVLRDSTKKLTDFFTKLTSAVKRSKTTEKQK